jgi:hypothetical protein
VLLVAIAAFAVVHSGGTIPRAVLFVAFAGLLLIMLAVPRVSGG